MSRPEPADLPAVINEIVAAVLKGDWIRYAEGGSDRFYYIIRERDHSDEVARGRAFREEVAFGAPEADLFWEWYLKAALAEEPSDRLDAARKRVMAEGV